ncbi:MAG: hypothetical protein ACSLFN_02995 [Candidatus Limnocylindrales bacterium]
MGSDPNRRSPGSWPRDRPIRWRGVAGNLTWFVFGTAAGVAQLALVVPLLIVAGSPAGEAIGGVGRICLTLAWGGLTLWAAWSWVFGRWRVVAAPLVTAALLWVVATLAG